LSGGPRREATFGTRRALHHYFDLNHGVAVGANFCARRIITSTLTLSLSSGVWR
jgi:hypothetical protein